MRVLLIDLDPQANLADWLGCETAKSIAGFLAVCVPPHVWKTLFLEAAPAAVQIPANAIAGAVIAILTFVRSIGNVPMAATLWGTSISFGAIVCV